MGGDILQTLTAGLPNIIGSVTGNNRANFNGATGAFEVNGYTTRAGYENLTNSYSSFTFDASLSNIIYGNSDTVQPPAFALIPQIRF